MSYSEILYYATFAAVMVCWIIFAATFILRKSPESSGEKKRSNKAFTGILFNAAGYALVWMFRRIHPLLIVEGGNILGTVLSVIAILLAAVSAWTVISAVRTLGKQWAVAARVVEGHQLITEGPYAIVRNPIYSGMLGMLIATGLAVSKWYALPPAIALFWYGTNIRVKTEEQLLRETFGTSFDEYAGNIPSLIPKVF
jgi:protein-S-isoprenylcysteine O-methyltransferase Ste14